MTSSAIVRGTQVARKSKPRLPDLDLRPYAGRWVALVGRCVAGVGLTAVEAGRQHLRLAFSFVPEQEIEEAVCRLAAAMSDAGR